MRGTQWPVAVALLVAWLPVFPLAVGLAGEAEPKSPRMVCGSCPSGYALTGVTEDAKSCPDEDHRLVQCVPLGANLLSVCGSCPGGYRQVGSSLVPPRCGGAESGLMSQCQLEQLERVLPDPTRGGVHCPPTCAGELPTPGQGTLEPPKKYRPAPKPSVK